MKRDVSQLLDEFVRQRVEHKNILIIEGARQVGKTYLVEDYLKSISDRPLFQINLEENSRLRTKINASESFSDFEVVLRTELNFNSQQESIFFIDEAQESEKLGSFVRFMKEKWKYQTVILTGSSMSRIFHNARVPVGRIEYLRVYPYSFVEFLRASEKEHLLEKYYAQCFETSDILYEQLLNQYDRYLHVGGLPVVINSFVNGSSEEIQQNIRSEVILSQEDDFYRKEPNMKHHLFRDALRAVSSCLGYPFSLRSITENYRDAKAVADLLQAWHIILSCNQRSLSVTTALFHPKYYLYDVGVAKQLRETALPQIAFSRPSTPALRTQLGGLIENAVFVNMLSGKGFLKEIVGWKKGPKHQVEVDFIYPVESNAVPLEIKATTKLHQKHFHGVSDYLRETHGTFGIVVSAAKFQVYHLQGQTIVNLPIFYCTPEALRTLRAKYQAES